MRNRTPLAWIWHGLCAMALVLGLSAPQAATPSVPDWIAAAICHAPPEDTPPDQPRDQTHAHTHCALCQLSPLAGLPPVGTPAAPPRVRLAALPGAEAAAQPTLPAPRPYAARAPPRVG